MEFHHVVSIILINWVELLGKREKNSVATVGVFACVKVYVSGCVRYCVVISHMFVRS